MKKIFDYRRFESVKGILQGFFMLPLDFYIDRMHFVIFVVVWFIEEWNECCFDVCWGEYWWWGCCEVM